jgi:hypothetical protein
MSPMFHDLSVMKSGISSAIMDVLTLFKEKERFYLDVVEEELPDRDVDIKVEEEVVKALA